MSDGRLFAVKMRAARAGEHISGAERIVPSQDVPDLAAALVERAMYHAKGVPDEIHIKAEEARDIVHLESLAVSNHVTATPEEGRACAARLLAGAGVTRIDEIMALFSETYEMRGAMLLDADTLERLEPDHERGVRATYMDAARNGQDARCPSGGEPSNWQDARCPSVGARKKNHYAEAVVLATKVANAPGIVGEICVSDDPDYVTGYVATKEIGYCRITTIKKMGDPCGGRIFLYRGPHEKVPETIRFLQRQCVLVDNIPDCPTAPLAPDGRDKRDPPPGGSGVSPLLDDALAIDLREVAAQNLLRVCRERPAGLLSFASNDYQNLAEDPRLKAAACEAIQRHGAGSGASRLVTGTLPEHVMLERHLASFKGTEDAVVWATGYMANVGTISALVGKGDAVFSDELNHASIIDGCRLSRADVFVYRHGDMEDLARKLAAAGSRRRKLVVSDAVFSMDGDLLDLPAFLAACRSEGAYSMIDEAHATGVIGATGRGLTEHFGCKPDVILGTLSKALGSEGGFVCASKTVCDYLRNKSRSFIFSTAPGPGAMAAADAALSILESEPGRAPALCAKAARFAAALGAEGVECATQSAIVPIPVGDERKACEVSIALEREGIMIPAIRYPTVARGAARLRAAVDVGKSDGDLLRVAGRVAALLKRACTLVACVVGLSCLAAKPADPIKAQLREPVLTSAGYRGYSAAYARLAAADRAADRAWIDAAGTPAFDALRRNLRERALASFDGFPERTPLNARVTGVIKRDGYRIEKLLAESRPGAFVSAHVYVPDSPEFKPPYAAILVPCGHTETGKMGTLYQHSGVVCARAGFLGLVFDPVGQGERRERPPRKTCGLTHNACGALGSLIGQSTLRYRLWDGMRMLDYLESRPDVDASRIGAMGVSGGGTMSTMLAAFDPRVKAAAPACYITSMRRVVDGCGPQDSEQIIGGQLAWGLNHAGLLFLQSPLPILVCASHDDFFPFDGTIATMDVVREVSRRMGNSDRYALMDASGKHGWYASMFDASIDWMRRWLLNASDVKPLDPAKLRLLDVAHPKGTLGLETALSEAEGNVTPTGSVLDLPGSRSVYRMIADDLAAIDKARPALDRSARVSEAVRLSGMRFYGRAACPQAAVKRRDAASPSGVAPWEAVEVSRGETNGFACTRLAFVGTDGDAAPAVLFAPRTATGTPMLFAGDKGRAPWAERVAKALKAGCPALVLDVEGCGEVGVTKRRVHVGSCVDDGLGKIHYLLGETIIGRRAEQLCACASELARRFGAAPELVADGTIAISAAHAHAAEPKLFGGVRVERAPLSWRDAIGNAVTEPVQWTFTDSVPGALKFYDWPELLP